MCHCDDCQRRTGSVFSIAAFFPREAVTVQGGSKTFTRASLSGSAIDFHFCPDCGSTVWWEPARMPHLVGIGVGAFADAAFPAPEQSVWTRDKHRWLTLPDHMVCYDVMRPAPPPAS